jgi:acetyl esterase/lipase
MPRSQRKPSSNSLLARLSILLSGLIGLLSGCSAARVIDVLTPSSAYVETHDVAYGEGARRMLDVYVPATLKPGSKAPVVVFFYGGSWREGDKKDYRFVADALTTRGIITIIADYRVFPEVSYPGFVEDSAAATAWTIREIARFGGDTKRIFIAGHSAGAYDAAMVAFDPRWLAAYGLKPDQLRGFVGLAGPYNFLPIVDAGVKEVFHWPSTSPDTQPINHVTKDSIQSLLIAARKDTFVYPDQNTIPMAERLKAVGADVTLSMHSGVNHVTLMGSMARPLRFLAPVDQEFSDFVLTH